MLKNGKNVTTEDKGQVISTYMPTAVHLAVPYSTTTKNKMMIMIIIIVEFYELSVLKSQI